jgi:hypothetical protein
MRNTSKYAQLALLAAIVPFCLNLQANPPVTVIFNFTFPPDTLTQDGTLVMDSSGALYGPTSSGGTFQAGAIFQLTPPPSGTNWNENTLYSFTGGADGNEPYQALIFDAKGNLYGSTLYGGTVNAACPDGCGVVFELSPPAVEGGAWTQIVLYSFSGGLDGAHPNGNLVFDAKGAVYGTASAGGTVSSACPTGCGVAFQLSPPAVSGGAWTHNVLYSFMGTADGAVPGAGLVFDENGALYGTTFAGGTVKATCSVSLGPASCGVVFQLVPPAAKRRAWTEKVIYSFPGGDRGSSPDAVLVFDQHGYLYGTALYGGKGKPGQGGGNSGVIFQMKPPSKPRGQWQFREYLLNHTRGNHPYGGLAVDSAGNLYGTALFGGAFFVAKGLAFKLTPPATAKAKWKEVLLHSFTAHADGGNPMAGILVGPGNVLYGTTVDGGSAHGGTAFLIAQ